MRVPSRATAALLLMAFAVMGCSRFGKRGGSKSSGGEDDGEDPKTAEEAEQLDAANDACNTEDFSAKSWVPRLLSPNEYANTILDVFGLDVRAQTAALDVPVDGTDFSVTLTDSAATAGQVGQFANLAKDLAPLLIESDFAKPLNLCDAGDAPCRNELTRKVMKRLYRRTLSDEEVGRLNELVAKGKSPQEGSQLLFRFALQSPHFLYKIESPKPDASGVQALAGSAVATRLAAFLWHSAPDEELIDLGERGALFGKSLNETVDRMLADERAKRGWHEFTGEWLELKSIEGAAKDATLFPEFTPALVAEFKKETSAFLEDLAFASKAPLKSMFDARHTFLTPTLATHYGFAGVTGSLERFEYPEDEDRAGVLSQGLMAAVLSHADETSAVRRGVSTARRVLCANIPPPPPVAPEDVKPEEPKEHDTARDHLKAHVAQESCATCHKLIDPTGLAFEGVDPLGRTRKAYKNGRSIDLSGKLEIEGGGEFETLNGLAKELSKNPEVERCIVRQLFHFASGDGASGSRRCRVRAVQDKAGAGNVTYEAAVREIVRDRSFRFAPPPKD